MTESLAAAAAPRAAEAEPVTETAASGPLPRFELPEWRERYRVVAGITGRGAGLEPFDLGLWSATPAATAMERWRALQASLGDFHALVLGRQVHGGRVAWHDDPGGWLLLDGVDGHATDRRGVVLAVTVADCVPVYLVDPVTRAIALLHAGWRGTARGILAAGVELLQSRGSRAEDLVLHLGVSICGMCYQVGREVFDACGAPAPSGGSGNLDLRAVLARQARGLGLCHMSTSTSCNAHDPGRFFSHRGAGGRDGRMVAYLGLLP